MPGTSDSSAHPFLDPGELSDGVLELVLAETHSGDPGRGRVPDHEFQMRLAGQNQEIGRIVLSAGNTDHIIH